MNSVADTNLYGTGGQKGSQTYGLRFGPSIAFSIFYLKRSRIFGEPCHGGL